MKILQTIAGFGAKSGGTSSCTYDLLTAMHRQTSSVDLLTLSARDSSDRLMGNGEPWIKNLSYDARTPYGYSRNIARFLEGSDYDIYHTNGLWMHCNHETAAIARRKGKPYLITPHGMLYPLALKRSFWKKWPLMKLYFNEDIHKASCIHVTCKQEMEYVREFGYKGSIAVIPNPANVPDYVDSLGREIKGNFMRCGHPRKFGFLGRLHPIKKIENLLYGMASLGLSAQNCELVIIGSGNDEYEQFLRAETKRLHLDNSVVFMGFVQGKRKYELLAELCALFVPSDFENFGMIVPEALSVGTPVMASLGTPWEELNSYECGWWLDRSPENIASVMKQIMEMPLDQLLKMGKNGKRLIEEKYLADHVASKMNELYSWIGNKGGKPNFVYFD